MNAATGSTAGAAGLVPAPQAGAQDKFLRGDGTWVDLFSEYDAMVFKGIVIQDSDLPTSGYSAGWTYRAAADGIYKGEYCEVGDLIIAINDYDSSTASNADWAKIEHNIDGTLFMGHAGSALSDGTKLLNVTGGGVVTTSSSTVGSLTKPVFLNAGTLTEITHSLNATINSGTANQVAYYSDANMIDSKAPAWAAWTAGTTAGPQANIQIGNATYTSSAIPAAAAGASGIVTTNAQQFDGDKTFKGNIYPQVTNTYNLGSTSLYWNNAYIKNMTYSSGDANRLVWTDSNNLLKASSHYANETKVAINSSAAPTENFYVNGTTNLGGNTTTSGSLTFTAPATWSSSEISKIILAGADNKNFHIGFSGSGTNVDVGWSYASGHGAGLALRSSSYSTYPGQFILYARKDTTSIPYQLKGDTSGLLYWAGNGSAKFAINSTSSDYTLYVNGQTKISNGTESLLLEANNTTAAEGWISPLICSTPNAVASSNIYIALGVSNSAKDRGNLHFYYAGAGSNNNHIALGLHSQDYILRCYGNGNVSIGANNNNYKLYVNGAVRIQYGGKPANLYLYDDSNDASTHSIIRFGAATNENGAYIFLNGPSRTTDGGANTLTIRNNVGNLRLNNNTIITGNCDVGTATAGSNNRLTVNGKVVINPSYHTTNGFDEGIRINLGSNGWASINFGNAAGTTSGSSDGAWLMGRRGSATTATDVGGAVGDFTIEEEGSTGAGLTIHKNSAGATLYTNKPNDVFAFRIIANKDATTIGTGYQHGIHFLVPNMGTNAHAAGLIFGKAASSGQAGVLEFMVASVNQIGLGFWANNNILKIQTNQCVTVGNSTSTGSFGLANTTNNTGNGISLYGGAAVGMPQYGLAFAGTATFGTFGGVTDSWATYFTTSNTSNRGWIFKRYVSTDANTKKAYNSASIRATDGVFFGGGISLYHPNKNYWCGDFYINTIGTANSGDNNETRGTKGITLLRVGNNVAWQPAGSAGGDNNSTGIVRIYAENTYYTEIVSQTGAANRTFYLPNYNANMVAVHTGNNDAVGSATQPVYVAANGRVTACTAYGSGAAGYLSLPRVTQDYNTLPGNNLTMIKEYNSGSANRPTNHWYHAITSKGSDGNYGTQFAMGMTITRLYYRNYSAAAWSAWKQVWIAGDSVTSAVWNDYAEYRETDIMEAGRCVMEIGDDSMTLSTKRLQRGCSITSDTWGFAQGETEKAKTPIAVSGRVLAYPYESREEFAKHIGWPVCSGPNGTVSIMTEEEEEKYPSRIVGIISAIPDYEEWGGGENADRPPVKVNGRVWIKVK